MINSMQKALIKKDIRSITSNKRLFSVLIVVPLVMAVFMPTVFILTSTLTSSTGSDFSSLTNMLPASLQQGDPHLLAINLLINNIVPLFFLLIPVMASSVMAASSFVGEKEKHTLETLLYCPLTLRQVFTAKVLAAFLLSMLVSLISFVAMVMVVELEVYFTLGTLIAPSISWLILLVLVAPAVSIIAITLIVRGSAKAQTVEESQQRSIFLVIPIILLAAGQFAGVLLLSVWLLLGAGIIFAVIAWLLMRRALSGFTYETLL